jgi:hypothetical protein
VLRYQYFMQGCTALMEACCGHDAVVLLLLEAGANINLRDHKVWEPYPCALRYLTATFRAKVHARVMCYCVDSGGD